jgi:hypothetical protein
MDASSNLHLIVELARAIGVVEEAAIMTPPLVRVPRAVPYHTLHRLG